MIDTDKLLRANSGLSQQGEDALLLTVIVGEIALADGWQNLDECLAENSGLLEAYMRFAAAALRAVKRVNKTSTRH